MENVVWVVRIEDTDQYNVKIFGVFRDKQHATNTIRDTLYAEIERNEIPDIYEEWLEENLLNHSPNNFKLFIDDREEELLIHMERLNRPDKQINPNEFAFSWGIDNYFITKTQLL